MFGFNSTYEKSTQLFGLKSETFAGIQLRYDDVNDLALSRTKDRSINKERWPLTQAVGGYVGVL